MTKIQTHFSKTLILALAGGLVAQGAVLSGKINGGKGAAVVYIEAIPGKTFPASAKHIAMDQKSLLFQPHVIVVLVGSTVDFLNGDNVQHNIFWPAISGNKKLSHNMGTWPKGEVRSFQFDTPWHSSYAVQCASRDVRVYRRGAYAILCRSRRVGRLQDRERPGRQLHRHGVARGNESAIQARHACRQRDRGLHAHQIAPTVSKPTSCSRVFVTRRSIATG